MDETPIWMDMPGNYTLETKGTKTVTMTTTGHEKERFTIKLAALADGTKLMPLVLFKVMYIWVCERVMISMTMTRYFCITLISKRTHYFVRRNSYNISSSL